MSGADEIKIQRFNYVSAIFPTSGFSKNTERYAVAHQIFLIQYDNVAIFAPVIHGLLNVTEDHFGPNSLSQVDIGKKYERHFALLLS